MKDECQENRDEFYSINDLENYCQKYDLGFQMNFSEADRLYHGWVTDNFGSHEREFKRISEFRVLIDLMAEFAKSAGPESGIDR